MLVVLRMLVGEVGGVGDVWDEDEDGYVCMYENMEIWHM
jgi:hypothetical protein